MKTLIVEDDFMTRFVLQKFISSYGECHFAVNGVEAVAAFTLASEEGKPYDLICLDIMMPKMDGQEALKQIRGKEKELNIHSSDEVKIVMISALDAPKDVIEAYYKGGCTSYLVKPVTKETLNRTLAELKVI